MISKRYEFETEWIKNKMNLKRMNSKQNEFDLNRILNEMNSNWIEFEAKWIQNKINLKQNEF